MNVIRYISGSVKKVHFALVRTCLFHLDGRETGLIVTALKCDVTITAAIRNYKLSRRFIPLDLIRSLKTTDLHVDECGVVMRQWREFAVGYGRIQGIAGLPV